MPNLSSHLAPNLVNFGIIRKIPDIKWPGDDTSLDACRCPPKLEEVKNTAAESSLVRDNAGSESKKGCATEIEDTED